jgi:hypothetical protein
MIGGYVGNPIGGVINVSNIFLAATPGVYTITGRSAALNSRTIVTAGSYTINGSAAAFATRMVASAGSYAITGRAASFNTRLIAASGAYALTGQAVLFAGRMPVTGGAYAITGQAASLTPKANVPSGRYALTGAAVTFHVTMPCASGAYTISGSPAPYFETIRGAGGERRRAGGDKKLYRGKLELERRKITITDDEGRIRRVDLLRHLKPPPPFAPAPDWVLPDVPDMPPPVAEAAAMAMPPARIATRLPESLLSLWQARDDNDLINFLTGTADPLVEDIRQVLAVLHAGGQRDRLSEDA